MAKHNQPSIKDMLMDVFKVPEESKADLERIADQVQADVPTAT